MADAAASIRIRPGFAELRREAASRGIPLVVFSAGLGNVVKEVLRQCVEDGEQLPVVSNWLRFAPGGGHACGFDEPLVHMFNKDGARLLEQLGEAEWCGLTLALALTRARARARARAPKTKTNPNPNPNQARHLARA